jgi:predicted O-methyltransferase YrrM
MAGPAVQTEKALAALEGDDPELDDSTRGVVEFLRAVRADDAFETVLLPVGEGLLLAVKR